MKEYKEGTVKAVPFLWIGTGCSRCSTSNFGDSTVKLMKIGEKRQYHADPARKLA